MTEIKKPIPARLYNASQGGHVAGTEDIIDDASNKTQKEINTEVSDTFDLHQSEINALDSQNYLSYTAASGQTLADILPTTGAVDTIYRVGKWDGTQYDPTVYSEYAWDANNSVYKLMDVKEYGIDEEPTAGSDNLVKSGGVATYTLEKINEQDERLKLFLKYDNENDTLYVTDSDGYVVLKVDASGLSTTDIKIKYDNELITVAELIYLMNSPLRDNINRISASLQKLLYAFNTDYQFDDAFIVTDNNGYIALKLDRDGIHFVNNISTNSDEFVVTDKLGYVGFKVDKDGIKFSKYSYTNSDEFIVSDVNGNIGFKVNKDGVDYPGIVKMSDIPSFSMDEPVPDAHLSYDINLFIAHGQSNSANGNYPTPSYDFNDAICFASKTMDCGAGIDGLTEQQLYNYLGNGFTDMNEYKSNLFTMGGCMMKWMEKLQSALHLQTYDSLKYQFIGAKTGAVVNIDTLTDPSLAHYNRILRVLSATKHFADNIYKTVALPAIAYIQNEANGGSMTFKHIYDMLWVFGSNINHDIKAITGQSEDVIIFLYQTCQTFRQSNDAMLQLSIDTGVEESYELDPTAASYLKSGVELIDRSIFVFSIPFYPYKTHETVDPLHLSWTDGIFNVFGAYFGLDAAKIVNLESQKKVLHPISHVVRQINNKYVLEVKFDVPVEPLQFKPYSERFGNNASQTAVNGYEPNYGFKFADANYSDSSIDMIENVETVRCDTVKFVLSQTPVGKWLFYAYGGSVSGGNLCDSQGNIETFMVGNDKYLMDNWCPMFSYYID